MEIWMFGTRRNPTITSPGGGRPARPWRTRRPPPQKRVGYSSFTPQGQRRLDFRRAPRGNITGGQADRAEERDGRAERDRIGRRQAEEQRPEDAAGRGGEERAGGDADADE